MKIYRDLSELIGKTPLFEAQRTEKKEKLTSRLLLKLEGMNPAGSIKDRAALYMIRDAEKNGRLKKGAVIIEPTSGNTGIGLAGLCTAYGYRLILVMPETMSIERRKLLSAYGAEIVLTDGKKGMAGSIEKAQELNSEIENSIIMGQFTNPANAQAHYETTGPEIWEDTDGKIDVLVAGVGTGGTLTGTARYLKEKNPDIKIVAVEPKSSALLSGKEASAHKIQGIGANFIPELLDREIYDEIIPVSDDDAYEMGNALAKTEGILVGISGGAALFAACELSRRAEFENKTVVAILPDSGERYLSVDGYFN